MKCLGHSQFDFAKVFREEPRNGAGTYTPSNDLLVLRRE